LRATVTRPSDRCPGENSDELAPSHVPSENAPLQRLKPSTLHPNGEREIVHNPPHDADLANLVMVAAAATAGGGKASWLWLAAYFVVITLGELYLSPVSLSLVTKVAPARALRRVFINRTR
jgi:hypothetical protein